MIDKVKIHMGNYCKLLKKYQEIIIKFSCGNNDKSKYIPINIHENEIKIKNEPKLNGYNQIYHNNFYDRIHKLCDKYIKTIIIELNRLFNKKIIKINEHNQMFLINIMM